MAHAAAAVFHACKAQLQDRTGDDLWTARRLINDGDFWFRNYVHVCCWVRKYPLESGRALPLRAWPARRRSLYRRPCHMSIHKLFFGLSRNGFHRTTHAVRSTPPMCPWTQRTNHACMEGVTVAAFFVSCLVGGS